MKIPIEKQLDLIFQQQRSLFLEAPWKSPAFYADWLAQSAYFVSHSTRLLGSTIYKADKAQDPFLRRSAQHILEEYGHESLALKDILGLGFDPQQFSEYLETKLFYRNQYFGVLNFGSPYLMGYILFLEGIAVKFGPFLMEQINQHHGQDQMRFLKLHAEEDQDHLQKALQQAQAFDAEVLKKVEESLQISAFLYKALMQRLILAGSDAGSLELKARRGA